MIKPRLILDKIRPYHDSPEAIIITGMRRTGKTTLLKLIFSRIQSPNKLFLDLENPLNRKYFEETDYAHIKSSLEILGLDFAQRTHVFLDEIQLVPALPSVVKYLIDHYQAKFFLSGSASFYLKNLFSESLSGRKFIFELFPLTFGEFLVFKDSPLKIPGDPRNIARPVFESISLLYDEYLRFGGFPGVVLKTNPTEKAMTLDDIFTSYFQWEVLQLGDFRKNAVIRDLIVLLAQRIGSKLDVQKISKELGISRPTLYEYISFLEGTFFFKLIRPYARAKDTEIRKSPKVYLCDTGLANRLAKLDEGRIFENSIFQNLRAKGEIAYYEKKNGAEIDFLLDKTHAFEAKITPRQRDVNQLKRVAEELGMKSFHAVSKNFTDLKNTLYGFMI
ncbi:MAG: ATP-binding protein [Candidatus Aminicenantales bacterium]